MKQGKVVFMSKGVSKGFCILSISGVCSLMEPLVDTMFAMDRNADDILAVIDKGGHVSDIAEIVLADMPALKIAGGGLSKKDDFVIKVVIDYTRDDGVLSLRACVPNERYRLHPSLKDLDEAFRVEADRNTIK